NAVDAVTDLLCPENGGEAFIDQIMNARAQTKPVSTGMKSMDIDMEGGVRRPGESQGGRLFTLAARTGVGKTILGVYSAVNLAYGGLTVGFISAELDKASIYARIWASASYVHEKGDFAYVDKDTARKRCAAVGDIESPPSDPVERNRISEIISQSAMAIQNNGGKILIEDPWGADVDAVVNSLRSMKAKNPELRCVVLDHFHVLARHKGAPNSDAAMLEDRAYKLMNCAKQLEIDLIVLAQMNRVGMGVGDNSAPTLDQIRGTDALSHVSHAVWIVRRETGNKDDDPREKAKKPLELHHAKTRGRQAYWCEKDHRMQGVSGGFIDRSILKMDYAYSAVNFDDTVVG
ncbi:MAG: DnaB-like helicase C-terminal domain-containing protein, partial [Synechococcus sp.]